MTYFNHTNCEQRTRVFDVNTKEEIKQVNGICTGIGVVECFEPPLRINDDHLVTYTYRYRAIHPIYGGGKTPCMFLCFDRIGEAVGVTGP